MSWRDNLQPAKFRGVPFSVVSAEYASGRRHEEHEYPFKDIPYFEDLGKSAGVYTVACYVIQNIINDFDYFKERDALKKALEKEGSGPLIHPSFGTLNVGVQSFTLTEQFVNDGGIARFNIVFIEAGKNVTPGDIVDNEAEIDTTAEESNTNNEKEFAEKFSVDEEPGFSILSAIATANSSFQMVKKTIASVQNKIKSSASSALASLNKLQSNIDDLVNAPANFGNSLISSFNSFTSLVGLFGDTVNPAKVKKNLYRTCTNACLSMNRFGETLGSSNPSPFGGQLESVPLTTDTRIKESGNQIVSVNLVRNTAIITAVRIAVRIPYSSFEESNAMLLTITKAIDDQLLKMGDEAYNSTYLNAGVNIAMQQAYFELENLRAVFTKIMINLGATLARIIEYETPAANLSTLELAYDRFEDINRDEEIYNRNRLIITHPGFIPQKTEIEILSE